MPAIQIHNIIWVSEAVLVSMVKMLIDYAHKGAAMSCTTFSNADAEAQS